MTPKFPGRMSLVPSAATTISPALKRRATIGMSLPDRFPLDLRKALGLSDTSPAAIDQSGRHVAPDDPAELDLAEKMFQPGAESPGAGQPEGVHVGKGGEHPLRGQ